MSVSLFELIRDENCIEALSGDAPERIIVELLEKLAEVEGLSPEAVDSIRRSILAREREATTGIGNGIAIPHMKECPHIDKICAVFGRSMTGVEYGSIDGELVNLFFLVLTPEGGAVEHVQLMRKVARLSRDAVTMRYLTSSENFDRLPAILQEIDDQVT